jgi:hypothetical protein
MMCEYCEEGELLIDDEFLNCCVYDGILTVGEEENGNVAEVEINYCPMCGRRLREDV